MSVRFIIGASGTGKSDAVFKAAIEASKDRKNKIKIIVPEQFTLETQKKLVGMHPNNGIINIDIVSFNRLALKLLKLIGGGNTPIMDETGKNLIVRKVISENADSLGFFTATLNKNGAIEEIKSAVSELIQYGITTEELQDVADRLDSVKDRRLKDKISDIRVIYDAFKEEIDGKNIVGDELLTVLNDRLLRTNYLKDSYIYLDGFTGFTPLQYRLLRTIISQAREVVFSVTSDKDIAEEDKSGLFGMSKEFVSKIRGLAQDVGVDVLPNVFLENTKRYVDRKDLEHFEKNFLRTDSAAYDQEPENVYITEALDQNEEIRYLTGKIYDLTRNKGYRYKDIAVITGNLSERGRTVSKILTQNSIPNFLDVTTPLTGNHFIDYLKFLFRAVNDNYSLENILGMIKTGFTSITDEDDIYMLENYCLACGIDKKYKWNRVWDRRTKEEKLTGKELYDLDKLNELRESIVKELTYLQVEFRKCKTVKDISDVIGTYFDNFGIADRIRFINETYNTTEENEQVYTKVTALVNQIEGLLGDKEMSISDYFDIFEAGIDSIDVGLIPSRSDSVIIGDMERTRLNDIKVLFVLGMNEGIIPQAHTDGGVFTETDKLRLFKEGIELSPSNKEKSFIQQYYLYLMLTKPSDKLFISYMKKDASGDSILPSYVLRRIKSVFPKITVRQAFKDETIGNIVIPGKRELILPNASRNISEKTVDLIYGNELKGSISKFEIYTSCMYAHFLRYGLGLKSREEYEFNGADIGTMIHEIFEKFIPYFESRDREYEDIENPELVRIISDLSCDISEKYDFLKDSGEGLFLKDEVERIAKYNAWVISNHIKRSNFTPDMIEKKFTMKVPVNDSRDIIITGKIDRIDSCTKEGKKYVRIIDYKTGKNDIEWEKIYDGRSLQLFTYLLATNEIYTGQNIIPAGVLYHIAEIPSLRDSKKEKEELTNYTLEQLRLSGIVNVDENIIELMDKSHTGLLIKDTYNSKGELKLKLKVACTTEQFINAENFEKAKIKEIGESIFNGKTDANPYKDGNDMSCEYCEFKDACGFSSDLPGHKYRKIPKKDEAEIIHEIVNYGE